MLSNTILQGIHQDAEGVYYFETRYPANLFFNACLLREIADKLDEMNRKTEEPEEDPEKELEDAIDKEALSRTTKAYGEQNWHAFARAVVEVMEIEPAETAFPTLQYIAGEAIEKLRDYGQLNNLQAITDLSLRSERIAASGPTMLKLRRESNASSSSNEIL